MKNILKISIRHLLILLVRMIAKALFRIQTCHSRNIPTHGGGIIIANHTSYIDFIVLVAAIHKPIYFVMNGDLYKKRFLNFFLECAGCIPITPAIGKSKLELFNKTVLDLIDAGHLVVIFPEGTVSRTGQMLPFKKGIEVLSAKSSGFILPVHIDGMHGTPWSFRAGLQKMIQFRLGLSRKKIRIRFGKPLYGGHSRFDLWQEVKQLEALNLSDRVSEKTTLKKIIHHRLLDQTIPLWCIRDQAYFADQVQTDLALLDENLRALRFETSVAVLLDTGYESMVVYLWLLLNGKTMVLLDPAFSAEEQSYALRKSKAKVLITTADLRFMSCAPVAQQSLYVEDVFVRHKRHAIGQLSDKICYSYNQIQNQLKNTKRGLRPAVITFERGDTDTLVQYSFDEQQILLSLESLRQVYFFEKGGNILSDLPLWKPGGVVLHLLLPLASKVILVQTNEQEIQKHIHEHNCPLLVLTSASAKKLLHCDPLSPSADLFISGIQFNGEMKMQLRQKGFNIYPSSHSDVACGVFAINQPDYRGLDVVGKPLSQQGNCEGTIGKALPGFVVSVRNAEGKILPPGVAGELWIASVAVARHEGAAHEARRLREVNLHLPAAMDEAGFIFPLAHSA